MKVFSSWIKYKTIGIKKKQVIWKENFMPSLNLLTAMSREPSLFRGDGLKSALSVKNGHNLLVFTLLLTSIQLSYIIVLIFNFVTLFFYKFYSRSLTTRCSHGITARGLRKYAWGFSGIDRFSTAILGLWRKTRKLGFSSWGCVKVIFHQDHPWTIGIKKNRSFRKRISCRV